MKRQARGRASDTDAFRSAGARRAREAAIARYLEAVSGLGLGPDTSRLREQMRFLYGDIDFESAAVLDVGGGGGLHSHYAACLGAAEVVCLEPEADGSTHGARTTFQRLSGALRCGNVELQAVTLDRFASDIGRFDIIILHDSINHLNEDAFVAMSSDTGAKAVYRDLCRRLSDLGRAGARLIVCDCSSRNFFAALGVPNCFDPSIEWRKHHTPETLIGMLAEAGFGSPVVRWSSPNRLGALGRALLGNRVMAYFFTSHFCIRMEKAELR